MGDTLRTISMAWSLVHALVIFMILYEPRLSRKGNVIATAVCRRAGAWRSKNGNKRWLTVVNGGCCAPVYSVGLRCRCVVWLGQSYRRGMPGNLMAAAVCSLRGRDACIRLIRLIRLIREVWVRHVIPRGFAVPQFGVARAMSYHQGDCCSSAPQQQLS